MKHLKKLNFKILFCLAYLFFSVYNQSVYAKKVEIEQAKQIAVNFYLEHSNTSLSVKSVSITDDFIVKDNSFTVYYIFNFSNKGFVIVSADDAVTPILGYSYENIYVEQNQPPQFVNWMNSYKKQITEAITLNYSSTPEIKTVWEHLNVKSEDYKPVKEIQDISPLLVSKWNQDNCYNDLCPVDTAGPGGRCYVGCVATAMGQLMYYYKYPNQGQGSHSYLSSYGTLTANFGATTYDWNAMTNTCNNSNPAISTLLYHCGVSVNMNYAPDGSAAFMIDAKNSLKNYFKYSSNIKIANKSLYTNSSWESLLKNELNNQRPVLYTGNNPNTGAGHAFVCDGYQGTNYFHFNWGWSGYYNGYFYLDNLNPGGSDFNSFQQAIYNIYPASAYPYFCSGTKNLTSTSGSFEDGSGPSNYQSNSNCSWLIAPTIAGHINLSFDYFNTEASNDVVTVYDGSNTSAPVLGTFSCDTIPPSLSSTGATMYVTFTSNGSVNLSGWQASYSATPPVYCSGQTTLTATTDTFSDGSGPNDYNNGTLCKWQIEPANAGTVTLHFLNFNTEAVVDMLRVIDPVSSSLLATYSGTSLPTDITSYSGKMLIMFITNSSNVSSGWTVYYTSTPLDVEEHSIIKNISIYPNPVNDKLNISFSVLNEKGVLLQIFDIAGREIFNEALISNSGTFNKIIDMSEMKKGIYTFRIITKSEVVIRKIVLE